MTSSIRNSIRIIPRDTEFLDRKLGPRGEIFYDQSTNTLRLYNGNQVGGYELAKADLTNVSNANFSSKASAAGIGGSNASNLTSGTVPVARLGLSGTRDNTTYLRGDNTWAAIAGGGASNSFQTITVAGQSNVVADSATDTLTLVAGTGISIATNAGSDTITITNTVGAGITTFAGLDDVGGNTIDKIYLPAITMLVVTNNGAIAYRFDQYGNTDDPTVYAINGTTIAFNLQATGHPFLIQDGAGNNYNTGLTHVSTTGVISTGSSAQGKDSGTLYWKIPDSISGPYRYQCGSHAGMVGNITIKNFGSI